MGPTFFDFFKSFYYTNTYIPPVDLSKQALSKHLMEKENPEVAKIAQRLISDPEVQQVLSATITYDRRKMADAKKILVNHGFRCLSNVKPIIEHDDLPGWIIKPGAKAIPGDVWIVGPSKDKHEVVFPIAEDGLLRIEMAERIARIAKEENIEVILPKKKLVAYANAERVTDPTQKYCILSEKIHVLSPQNTALAIKRMSREEQRTLAQKISTLVQKAGWADPAMRNIRLTPEGKLVILDTEPFSLMAPKRSIFSLSARTSMEKCARVGLFTLLKEITLRNSSKNPLEGFPLPGFEGFYEQVRNDYEKISSPKISYAKIACSALSLGSIPIVQAIIAFSYARFAQKAFKEIEDLKESHQEQVRRYYDECAAKLESLDFVKEYKKQLFAKSHPFFLCIEGVPF